MSIESCLDLEQVNSRKSSRGAVLIIVLLLFEMWPAFHGIQFDMFCATTRFYFCFVCQHWRRQPQAKLADHGDETAAVHRRPPGWSTEMTVHNAAKTPLKWWKSQHRMQRKGNNPWLSTMCLWPETTDSADTHVGTYTVTLHKRQSLPMQDHHANQHILHRIRPRCAFKAYEHVAVGSCTIIRAFGTSNIFISCDKCVGFRTSIIKFDNWKNVFNLFPLKPSAHISLDAFEETLPPSQAREFGHLQALLMFFRWSIMPQSQSLQSWLATFILALS